MPATFHVLQEGMAGPKVRSTVSLVIDGDRTIVIDPGMAPSQSAIVDPLRAAGQHAGNEGQEMRRSIR